MNPSFRQASIVVAALVLGAALPAQSAPFGVVEEALPRDATFLAAFDEDLDGDEDLVATNGLYRNDGAGRFALAPGAVTSVLATTGATSSARADCDADGHDDVVVAALGSVRIFFARPGGASVSPPRATVLPIQYHHVAAVVVGDVDGDGFPDAAVGRGNDTYLGAFEIHRGGGAAGFQGAAIVVALPPAYVHARLWAAGDFDDDGLVDLVVSGQVGGSAAVDRFVIYGSPVAPTATATAAGFTAPIHGVAIVDKDLDGDDDVVLSAGVGGAYVDETWTSAAGAFSVASFPAAGAALWTRIGSGAIALRGGTHGASLRDLSAGFPGAELAAVEGHFVRSCVPIDLEPDGDLDVVLRYAEGVNRAFYRQPGGGLWEDAPDLSLPAAYVNRLLVADADGDGDPDVLLPAFSGGCPSSIAVALNDGRGRFSRPTGGLPCGGGGLGGAFTTGDFDGDGDLDVFEATDLVANPGSPAAAWLHLQGPPLTWTAVASPGGVLGRPSKAITVDHDLDGDQDVLVAYESVASSAAFPVALLFGGLYLYANLGTGLSPTPLVVNLTASDVAAFDFNQDGFQDYLLSAGAFAAHFVPASGVSCVVDGATSATTPLVAANFTACDASDATGDGVADLLLHGVAPGGFTAVNPVLGPFSVSFASLGFSIPASATLVVRESARFIDLDGDPFADVIVGDLVFRNDGLGALVLVQTLPSGNSGTTAPQDYAAADLDLDGDVDLIDPRGRPLWNLTRQLARLGPPAVGRTSGLEVRGAPSEPWSLFASLGTAQLPAGPWGVVRIDPTTAVLAATGACDATGSSVVALAVPDDPALVGFSLSWQAALLTQLRVTNVETVTVLDL
ncbi:MAG TPA: VCBS repeat-containing protein [Planctomycetota bacterium]|nr:VCBS repeat-containing protein [Planctomycetota bacterium]